jgi:mRNA interferase MazF
MIIQKVGNQIITPGIEVSIKEELANALRIAIGHRSILQFVKDCRMTDASIVSNILKKQISVLPEREFLRVIERASQGRVTYSYLCQICDYAKYDPDEDRTWANYYPERGCIYMVDFGMNNMDSEQDGIRPALIISNNMGNKHSSIISVAPLTSKNKKPLSVHVDLTRNEGLQRDSIICLEQTKVISKRRLFFNGTPIKVLKLSDEKIWEVNIAIEKQFGIIDLMFNQDHAFELVEQIETLRNTKKINQSRSLVGILNDKINELIDYCKTYNKSVYDVMSDYEEGENFACVI